MSGSVSLKFILPSGTLTIGESNALSLLFLIVTLSRYISPSTAPSGNSGSTVIVPLLPPSPITSSRDVNIIVVLLLLFPSASFIPLDIALIPSPDSDSILCPETSPVANSLSGTNWSFSTETITVPLSSVLVTFTVCILFFAKPGSCVPLLFTQPISVSFRYTSTLGQVSLTGTVFVTTPSISIVTFVFTVEVACNIASACSAACVDAVYPQLP